ncbi:CubicO group peptidase, beta-lactamase class C family [Flavobacterium fluvii]|uniref:CubicO group peptidase, beta-lactamase class C family n=1 Tax=Flavobacterium fluvii TaxID=468056 RepID=A0A1M5LFL8_9FLAO|nr:serine hydrolase domain-containing protein [Flavobacterium fluvii]SHG63746.1 CubicO group peptidase, beta-lactamase class C family [Flavobacterium fluvii]
MTKKITITLFLGLVFGTTFAQNLNTAKLDSLFQILEAKDKFMGSIAVSENGKVFYTKSIGKDDIETNKRSTIATKYRIGSISKMFTSCLIFKAVEEKKLSLDQTIESYFPTIENANKITIGNLLNHRSGIHNFTNDKSYLGYNTQPKSEKEMVEIIANGKSDFEPNSKAEYSNSNYVLLSYVLEKTYKKTYKEIVASKIIKPLGLKNTYFGNKINIQNNECYSYSFNEKWKRETETDMSIPMGAGALVSNPTDLVLFIERLFANKIISQNSLDQMKTIKDNYGMGIFQVPFYDKKGYGHNGGIDGFSSVLSYFPDSKLAIALTCNGQNYDNNNIIIAVLSNYYGKKFEIPTFKTIELKTEDLDRYLGEYTSPDLPLNITITKDNLKLFAQATGQSAFPLDATEKDKFEFIRAGIKMEFNPKENQMTLYQGGKKFHYQKK